MRKIESKMNEAIRFPTNWSSGNTTVTRENEFSNVYLHGNLIARISYDTIQLYDGGWQSNTTKSRLNAILAEFGKGERVYQRQWHWYLEMADGSELPFTSGMKLL